MFSTTLLKANEVDGIGGSASSAPRTILVEVGTVVPRISLDKMQGQNVVFNTDSKLTLTIDGEASFVSKRRKQKVLTKSTKIKGRKLPRIQSSLTTWEDSVVTVGDGTTSMTIKVRSVPINGVTAAAEMLQTSYNHAALIYMKENVAVIAEDLMDLSSASQEGVIPAITQTSEFQSLFSPHITPEKIAAIDFRALSEAKSINDSAVNDKIGVVNRARPVIGDGGFCFTWSNPFTPGKLRFSIARPGQGGARHSYLGEGERHISWAYGGIGREFDVEGLYNQYWGCRIAVKIPDHCRLIMGAGSGSGCCQGATSLIFGTIRVVYPPNVEGSRWPRCPLSSGSGHNQ